MFTDKPTGIRYSLNPSEAFPWEFSFYSSKPGPQGTAYNSTYYLSDKSHADTLMTAWRAEAEKPRSKTVGWEYTAYPVVNYYGPADSWVPVECAECEGYGCGDCDGVGLVAARTGHINGRNRVGDEIYTRDALDKLLKRRQTPHKEA
jgi:hypothetical protein